MSTVSTKPYLLRAIWEWCVDQGFTPYLAALVDEQTRVPPGYARDGQIVLNLSSEATGHLQMANDFITFQARFGGVAHSLAIPVVNVIAIYARENGQGMAFEPEFEDEDEADGLASVPQDEGGEGPVAVEEMGDAAAKVREEAAKSADDAPRRPRPSHLTVVK
ncbi:ClpXP protease specificity-enhancing factor [Thauera linaloolentis]|uniref:ClpXP protease specificity-enhancing factor n=1 Tax=Thauera linaloolentis (strain DSM 12138 / JCM 21573 / CCUG 41526 / CIP 105981 / IAM 15112 / NBRC 102519 / 47Lol) TaxID=1123367 RepID=N6Z701_THAL4|nr:ClpXP protease specificity-enhancing factor [Thauera linaloolentis]ENO90327.1 ClpXP protease specificity-enhancing factor [Thauera linaloolentis 47Lol = DSM 12138]MCM8564100.1 ClpXP protease specificity-enhancing factor [Thauera linaloolentis]